MKLFKKIGLILLCCVIFFYMIYFFTKSTYSTLDDTIVKQIINGEVKLTYELFGALGDGVTNDYLAIKEAHDLANKIYVEEGISVTVYATEGKTYYLSKIDNPINVITDVDWQNANFIIDDYVDTNNDGENDINVGQAIFDVTNSLYVNSNIKYIELLNDLNDSFVIRKTTNNLLELVNCLKNNSTYQDDDYVRKQFNRSRYWGVSLTDDNKQYIRKGANADSGANQTEVIIIDSVNGDVLTDINWDYDNIQSVLVYPISDNDIVLENGIFLTKTNNYVYDDNGKKKSYSNRNIYINYTGNVTVRNVSHFVDEESHLYTNEYQDKGKGNLYLGFIKLNQVGFVRLEDLKLVPRTYTHLVSNGVIGSGGNGTYDLHIAKAAYIFLDNVSYSCADGDNESCYYDNMLDSSRWGIMGTNYTKNFFIIDSKLNRIDSHKGTTNLYVSDTVLGRYAFTLTGNGYFYANNVTVDGAQRIVNLRTDYGATWDGTFILDNINFISGQKDIPRIIEAFNDETHYFGYTTYFPDVYIRDLDIDVSENKSFSYVSVLSLADLSNVTSFSDTNKLYYLKSNFYLQNITMSSGNAQLFTNDFAKVSKHFQVGSYGGTNKYKLFMDSSVSVPDIISSVDNPKFGVVSEMNNLPFEDAKLYFQDMYNKYYQIDGINDEKEIVFDTDITVDYDNNYIKYLSEGMLVSELLNKVDVKDGNVVICDRNGNDKKITDLLFSGDVLKIYVDDSLKEEYLISIMGDTNGDGIVDLIDLVQVRKHMVGWINPDNNSVYKKTGIYYEAIDMNYDNEVDLIDLVKIRKLLVE